MEFKIIKQRDPDGCIAACAASVLRHLEVPGSWSEDEIMKMYEGFQILENFLVHTREVKGWRVRRTGREENWKELIATKNREGIPILCHVKGNVSHCVVLFGADERGVNVFDPGMNQPESRRIEYAELDKIAGSIFWLEKDDSTKVV